MRGVFHIFLIIVVLITVQAEAKLCEALVAGSDGKVLDLHELKQALRDDLLTKYHLRRINLSRDIKWVGPERPQILTKDGGTYSEMLQSQRLRYEKLNNGRDALSTFLDITIEVGLEQQRIDIMASEDMKAFVEALGKATTLTFEGKREEALNSLREAWTRFQLASADTHPEKTDILALTIQNTFSQLFEVHKVDSKSPEITKEIRRILDYGRLQGQRLFAKQHVIIMKGVLEQMGGAAEKISDDFQAGSQLYSHFCSIRRMLNIEFAEEFRSKE